MSRRWGGLFLFYYGAFWAFSQLFILLDNFYLWLCFVKVSMWMFFDQHAWCHKSASWCISMMSQKTFCDVIFFKKIKLKIKNMCDVIKVSHDASCMMSQKSTLRCHLFQKNNKAKLPCSSAGFNLILIPFQQVYYQNKFCLNKIWNIFVLATCHFNFLCWDIPIKKCF